MANNIIEYKHPIAERFMRYVQIDTQSNPKTEDFPSTQKQKELSNLLAEELMRMGIVDAHMDSYGYVYATIPSNTHKNVPVICFCSHVDTAPDCSGTNVKPILHQHFDGTDMVLPDDATQVIGIEAYPYLKKQIGNDIITASGKTLLGADDKAGVAIIMEMVLFFQQHQEIPHGTIKILFTPDEEVGRGTDHLDLEKLGANFAYTLDGGEVGTLEEETFSANGVVITIYGVIAHPGYAKGKMVNALRVAGEILASLPQHEWSPELTEGREGFVHALHIEGSAEEATIHFLIRDFDTAQLNVHQNRLKNLAETILSDYPSASMDFVVKEQYRNMKEIVDQHPQLIAYAEEAYKLVGIEVVKEPIRGGTDGSRLSFLGLPCPNLFTGMQAIHSKHEWVSVQDMVKAVAMLVQLVQVWEMNSRVD